MTVLVHRFLICVLSLLCIVGAQNTAIADSPDVEKIRKQTEFGLNISAALRAAVTEAWLIRGVLPATRSEAGMVLPLATDTNHGPVASVDVQGGVIIVMFGSDAEPELVGKILTISPYVRADDSIEFVCGYAEASSGSIEAGAEYGVPIGHIASTVEERYLPKRCRSKAIQSNLAD